ncbi:MAG: hypothetical protein Q8P30_01220 [Candidatus Uhrbacteria bacterium]|nr:hypothetical protein [Candidatus Uhrbacteria bacterium]
MSNERKSQVDFAGTHRKAHIDDLEGLVQFLRHGLSRYFFRLHGHPDRRIRVVFFEGDAELASMVDERSNALLFGTGKDSPYNDHNPDGSRKPDTCCAKLVVEDLDVADLPENRRMLAEVLRADTEGGQPHLSMANIVKTLHNHAYDADQSSHDFRMFNMWKKFSDAYARRERGDEPKRTPVEIQVELGENAVRPGRKSILRHVVIPAYAPVRELMKLWLVMLFGKRAFSDRVRPQIHFVHTDEDLKFGKGSLEERDDTLFIGFTGGQFGPDVTVEAVAEALKVSKMAQLHMLLKEFARFEETPEGIEFLELPNAVAVLNSHGTLEAHEVWKEVANILDAYEASGVAFNSAITDGELVMSEVCGVKFGHGQSDRTDLWKKAHTQRGAKAFVQRNSGGNVIIFLQREVQHLVPGIARGLVVEEARLCGLENGGTAPLLAELEAVLEVGGKLPGAPHWHLWAEGGFFLNGSSTHAETPTKLSLETVRELVESAIVEATVAPE